MEILEERETETQFVLQTFTTQLDKAQNEIKQLIYENADLKGKVTFFELKAREHEKNINMVLESKQEIIEILREEKEKLEKENKQLKEQNNKPEEKKRIV